MKKALLIACVMLTTLFLFSLVFAFSLEKSGYVEAKVVGIQYYNVFLSPDGRKFVQRISKDDYFALGLVGARPVSSLTDGSVWLFSASALLFDTPSGFLDDGYFALVGDSYVYRDGLRFFRILK